MFKAKLIEDSRYYKLVRNQSLLLILLFIPYAWVLSNLDFPAWGWGGAFLIYFVTIFLGMRNNKVINLLLSRKVLEIDDEHIRVIDKKDQDVTEWKIHVVDTIITNKEFSLPNDKFPAILKAWKGNPTRNFLEINHEGEDARFEFHLESNYMRIQISKIVDSWISKGVYVKRK